MNSANVKSGRIHWKVKKINISAKFLKNNKGAFSGLQQDVFHKIYTAINFKTIIRACYTVDTTYFPRYFLYWSNSL